MKKYLLTLLASASLILGGVFITHAAPVTPIPGGGTGTSTIPADGNLLIGQGGKYVFIASSSLGGGSGGGGGVQTSSAGIVNTLPFWTSASALGNSVAAQSGTALIVKGAVTSTITGDGSSSVISYFNYTYNLPVPSQLSLNGCMGSSTITDAGGCINYIYSIAASSSQLFIPPFYYAYSTGIKINTQYKQMNIIGAGGGGFYTPCISTLQYTATGTAYTYDVQNYSSAGIGLYNLCLVGPAGVGNTGSSTTLTNTTGTIGALLGGNNGATGFNLEGVGIWGFAKGLVTSSNTFIIDIDKSVIQKNGMAWYAPASTNSFENDKITNSLIGDCNYGSGSIATNCIYYAPNASADITIQGTDFDDAQFNVATVGVNNIVIKFNGGNHFEPPNAATGCFPFITSAAGQASNTTIYSSGNDYLFNGSIGNCPPMVNNGGNFISSGDTIGSYSNNATTSITFVGNQDANDTVNWTGLNQVWMTNVNQSTFVYASNTITEQGLGKGSSNPVYDVNSSNFQFPNLTIGKFLALDGNGNVVTTGTPSGGSGGSGFTSSSPFNIGFVPYFSTSNQLSNSFIQQSTNGIVVASGTGTWPIPKSTASLLQLGSSSIQSGNASGTFIGSNASSGYNGDFINMQINSSSQFEVSATGTTYLNGWLGIGTFAPRTPLDVSSSNSSGLISYENSNSSGYTSVDVYDNNGTKQAGFGYGNSGSSVPYQGSFYFNTGSASVPIIFMTNNSERARVFGGGDISIGTTTDNTAKLFVNGSTTIQGALQDGQGNKYSTSTSSGGGIGNVLVTPSSTVSSTNFLFWMSNGSTTVSQTSSLSQLSGNTGINETGTLTVTATTTFGTGATIFTSNPTTAKSYVSAGSSTVAATIGGTLGFSATSTGNATSASTTLETFNIPTSTYLTVGDEVDVYAGGLILNNADTGKLIYMTVASTTVFNTSSTAGVIPASQGCNWFLESRGMLIAATTTNWISSFTDSCTSASTDDSGDAGNQNVTVTSTAPINISIFGKGTAAGDVTSTYFRVMYAPF